MNSAFFSVTMSSDLNDALTHWLLQHQPEHAQEELCFALWKPSTGRSRLTAIIQEFVLPKPGERSLHGNASFQPEYLSRVARLARSRKLGVAFLHSHLGPGWQSLSPADAAAEGRVIAGPTRITGLPVVGLTLGTDGTWSARFWVGDRLPRQERWCREVRVWGLDHLSVHHADVVEPVPAPREELLRTIHSWGPTNQAKLARLVIGVTGVGSVGAMVLEGLARMGAEHLRIFDPDLVKTHNLDRLVYATGRDVGRPKVDVAKDRVLAVSTAESPTIHAYQRSVHERSAYQGLLDCDLIFACVDRAVGRDVVNTICRSHCIPVIDAGVEVLGGVAGLQTAHWASLTVVPDPRRACLVCSGQYDRQRVPMELTGQLDDEGYLGKLPVGERPRNENVFPFTMGAAERQLNRMIALLFGKPHWRTGGKDETQLARAEMHVSSPACVPGCHFRKAVASGDAASLPYYIE